MHVRDVHMSVLNIARFGGPGNGNALPGKKGKDGAPAPKALRVDSKGAIIIDDTDDEDEDEEPLGFRRRRAENAPRLKPFVRDEDEEDEDAPESPRSAARRLSKGKAPMVHGDRGQSSGSRPAPQDRQDNQPAPQSKSVEWYHRELVAYAKRTLRSLNAKRGEFVPISSATTGGADTLSIWKKTDDFVRTTPEAVLRTNIAAQNIIPDRLVAMSNFEDLWRISEMTLDELKKYPMAGLDASGKTLDLLVPQLAMIIVLSKGPNSCRISLSSSNAEDIGNLKTRRSELDKDIAQYERLGNATMRDRLAAERRRLGQAPKKMFYNTVLEPFENPEEQPSFAWIVSSMGTGKTIMSILTGAAVLRNEWEFCKKNFSKWKGSLRRVYEMIPMGANPTESDESGDLTGKLTRTMLVVSPDAVFGTMADVIQQNKDLLQAYIGVAELTVLVWSEGMRKETVRKLILEHAGSSKNKAFIFVTKYAGNAASFSEMLKDYSNVGFPVVLMDELAQQAGGLSCPSGTPLFYRSFGISATPTSLLDGRLSGLSKTNFVRGLIGSPEKLHNSYGGTDMSDRYNDAMKYGNELPFYIEMNRFLTYYVAADILLGHRIPMAIESASTMAPSIDIYNFKKKNTPLLQMDPSMKGNFENIIREVVGNKAPDRTEPMNKDDPSYILYSDLMSQIVSDESRRGIQDDYSKRIDERMKTLLREAAAEYECVRCGRGFTPEDPKCVFSMCCTAIYCTDCATNVREQCVQCGIPKGLKLPETGTMSDRLKLLQASRAITANMVAFEVLRAAITFQRRRVLVFADISTVRDLNHVTGIIEAAGLQAGGQKVWMRTLLKGDATLLPNEARASIIKGFKTGPVGGEGEPPIRILILNVGRGAFDQTTGLDLGETDMIVSIGEIPNPQQSYSRALRMSAAKRTYPLDIVRIANL